MIGINLIFFLMFASVKNGWSSFRTGIHFLFYLSLTIPSPLSCILFFNLTTRVFFDWAGEEISIVNSLFLLNVKENLIEVVCWG